MPFLQAARAGATAARCCIRQRRVALFGFWSIFVQLLLEAVFRHMDVLYKYASICLQQSKCPPAPLTESI